MPSTERNRSVSGSFRKGHNLRVKRAAQLLRRDCKNSRPKIRWGPSMFFRVYIGAPASESEMVRACTALDAFVADRGFTVLRKYVDNYPNDWLARPELFRLLSESCPGDVLLVERLSQLSCITGNDWQTVRSEIEARQVRIVALDLPNSWSFAVAADETSGRVIGAVNATLLDVLATLVFESANVRRLRQAHGQARAKAEGAYRGRKEDLVRNTGIATMLKNGNSYSQIQAATGCSRATVAKISKRLAISEHYSRFSAG